jgi:prepilin-type N-terminal cleavage/methylation domain-containing protein
MSNSKTFSLKTNKRGFTLIELSIVLIIIGLLIVAVNSGTSLIRNAKLRSITNEAKQYQVAVNSFFMKFDKYPGDFVQALGSGANASVAGNGNDQIEWRVTDANGSSVNEGSNAWLQLIDAGVLKEDIRTNMDVAEMMGNSLSLAIPIKHYQASAESSAGWIFNSVVSSSVITNYVQIVKSFNPNFDTDSNAPTIGSGSNGGSLNTSDSYSIDHKNDDGKRTSGDIRDNTGSSGNCGTAADSANYNLTIDTADVCSLAFKVTIN